ncbi:OmpP1/FadL family transporter [Persephonella sp.]|uniref:OmpP1/FadL family transporter n=1 Tax=Persephonella sp. TaxID=2060922 RepID=UPI00260D3D23|nr:OmpP1/FadL family transporter [Persephonella sp.]
MRKISLAMAGLLISYTAFGAAYKIPEQSTRAMATAAAYFASADHADTAYYNPAAMSWLENKTLTELGIKYIYLPRIHFKGYARDQITNVFFISDAKTKKEEFVVPYFHLVIPSTDNLRLGFSFTTPFGLSKRWSSSLQKQTAEEFTLKVFEFDTTAAYKINENFSLGAGLRTVYASGKIKAVREPGYKLHLSGDSGLSFGYILSAALNFDKVKVATIYKSEIKPEINGQATGNVILPGPTLYPISTEGSVKVVLPAEWRLGFAYTPIPSTTFDLTYEITFWGGYKKLDFNFDDPVAENTLGQPKDKHWHDSKTIRLGVRHQFNEKFTGMAGIAYDETPIPEKTQGFELPDANGWIFSLGGLWKPTNNLEVGLAYLYVTKIDRNIHNTNIEGKFTDMDAHLVNLSVGYKF